jgi:hypothetical protein
MRKVGGNDLFGCDEQVADCEKLEEGRILVVVERLQLVVVVVLMIKLVFDYYSKSLSEAIEIQMEGSEIMASKEDMLHKIVIEDSP